MPSGALPQHTAAPFTTIGRVANLLVAQHETRRKDREEENVKALALGIVADDLSGAAECASHALMRVSRSTVVLSDSSSAIAAASTSYGPRHASPVYQRSGARRVTMRYS